MDKLFCENLKNIRKEKGLSQKQVALKLNVVESCYANWEQGRTEPSISMLRKLCEIFKINIDVTEDFSNWITQFKKQGRRVIGAALGKKSLILGKDQILNTDIFVLGNEGHGLSDSVLENCSETIFIPIKENTESLNVSIASAILMWEISK